MIEASKLSHQVYKHLAGEILSGRLEQGEALQETDLAERLGVSRTPIREALARLAADGLVELAPNRRAAVRQLPSDQLVHIYQLREALEGMAAELACGRLTSDDFSLLDRLAAAVGNPALPRSKDSCHEFDAQLHRLIAARSGNPVLAREIGRYHDLVQLVRERVGDQRSALALAHRQHLEILAALKANDPVRSRQAMIEHIRTSCQVAVGCGLEAQSATKKRSAKARPVTA